MLAQLGKILRTGCVTEPAGAVGPVPGALGAELAAGVRQLFGRSLHIRVSYSGNDL